jgi:exopolysaccharide biosynthesis polyprenyl glycosylphosphotransferase
MLIFPKSTTGTALFALDSTLILAAWPFVLRGGRTDASELFMLPGDPSGYIYPVFDLILLFAMGLYRRDAILEVARSFTRVPMVVGMGASLSARTSIVLPLLAGHGRSHVDQTAVFAVATICFTLCAWTARLTLHGLLRRHVLRRRLLIVGAGQRAWDLVSMLGRGSNGLRDEVTLLHHLSLGEIDVRLLDERPDQIIHAEEFNVATAARAVDADIIIVAPDERRGMDLQPLLDCKKAGYPVIQYLTFVENEIRRIDLQRMELGWLVYSDGFNFGNMDRFLKRTFDLVVSSFILVVAAPLLLAGMIAVRRAGPGPVFYRQDRVTRDGRVFPIMRLRTLRAQAQGAVQLVGQRDSRVTIADALLRRARIDELPQLFNVLRGEMSFVGPRPEPPALVAELERQIPLYNERHMVKAGVTGWAQINCRNGASIDDARSKLSYDLYYVKNFSVLFDCIILLQTLRGVLWSNGTR